MRLGPFGTPELLIILLVVLLLFGAKRLPAVAKGLGQSVKEFRTGLKDARQEIENDKDDEGPGNTQA